MLCCKDNISDVMKDKLAMMSCRLTAFLSNKAVRCASSVTRLQQPSLEYAVVSVSVHRPPLRITSQVGVFTHACVMH